VNFVLAILSAELLILAFPRYDFTFLAPIALAPLLTGLARDHRPVTRFLSGWLAGTVFWGGSCYWIQNVLTTHAGMSHWMSWVALVLFALVKGLHLGLFALLAGYLFERRWSLFTVPALWVAIESTHTWLGFAWLDLGNAAIEMPVALRLAPFTGVYGLSFLFVMMSTGVALITLRRPRREFVWLVLMPLIYLLPPLPIERPGTETAVLVQPNISETAEWTPKWIGDMHSRLESLTVHSALESPGPAPNLIVWPEVPAPMYYDSDVVLRAQVAGVARAAHAYLLLNAVPHTASGAPLNSALLISPSGQRVGRYDKMNLVPFGEYVPSVFSALVAKVSTEAGNFEPGLRQVTLPAGRHNIGAFICYESVFPDFVRKFAADGADLLVNISNDGWYGTSAARYQHLKILRMRAAENNRWILRATNDGITATIDPAGRVREDLPAYVYDAARTSYSYTDAVTFYSRYGDWFVWLCALIAAAGLVAVFLARLWQTLKQVPQQQLAEPQE
jgi:apolipoprotein N-acyltransferase